MTRGKTKSGFEFEIDDQRMDDMEFIEEAAAAENDITRLPKVLEMILGKDQKRRLYDHVRTDDGRVPLTEVSKIMDEIWEAAGDQAKNS